CCRGSAETVRDAGRVRRRGCISCVGSRLVLDRIGAACRWRRGGGNMKLLTFLYQGKEHAGVVANGGVAPIEEINARHGTRFPDNLLEIIRTGVDGINTADVTALPIAEVTPRLPYQVPPKIWCIGLNYL